MDKHIKDKINKLFEQYSNLISIVEHPSEHMLDREDFEEACKELINYIKDL